MVDSKISALTAQTGANLATGDLFETVDISDTTMDASGTNKSITADELGKGLKALGGGMTLIASQVLASAAANVTFSSIPGTYHTLVLDVVCRSDSTLSTNGVVLLGRFNGDTGSNYDSELVQTTSVSAAATENNFQASTSFRISSIACASNTSGVAGMCRIVIPEYAATTFRKTGYATGGFGDGANARTSNFISAFAWRNTSAITSLTLFDNDSHNLITGSTFRLYGIT